MAPPDRFTWPAAQALVPSLVAQNFARGLGSPPEELLSVLGCRAKRTEVWAGGDAGQRTKKRDDVFVELDAPVPLGQLGVWQTEFREKLAESSDEQLRDRAKYVELVPAGVYLGAAAEPKEGVTVVDTDAISMLFKDDTRSRQFRDLLAQQDRKLISFQTAAELHAWILLRHFPEARIKSLEDMLEGYEVIYPDNLTSLLWAQLMDHCRAHGRPVGAQDCWVAATALRHGGSICTCNTKDYEHLPGVRFLHVATPPKEEKKIVAKKEPKEKTKDKSQKIRTGKDAKVAVAKKAKVNASTDGGIWEELSIHGPSFVLAASVAAAAGGIFGLVLSRSQR